jgi:ribosomal protein S18 acetylase RimI-like enzyme
MIEIVPGRMRHINTIANRIREIDKVECRAAGLSPKEALRHGLFASTIVWTMLIDGRAEAMFGACPISTVEGRGRPWMLATDVAGNSKQALVRLGRIYTDALHRHYPILENYVHADNDRAIRWLSRLGYAIGAVDVIGGHPLRGFRRCAWLLHRS